MTDVLVVADHRRGELRDVSFELLTVGREVTDAVGGNLHAAVISGNVAEFGDQLNREGVDTVHTISNGEEFNHDVYVQAVESLTNELDIEFLLLPNSTNGLDYAPAVANSLNYPYISDVVGLGYEDGTLEATREMYGSKIQTTVRVEEGPFVVTIRPGEWPTTEGIGDADVAVFDLNIDESRVCSSVRGFEEVGGGDVDITDADFLVSIGRGIEEEENLELIEALVDSTGATMSSSRPIVDNGWLPKSRQVGQSGKQVTPEVYLAIGISGAVQHVAGMKNAETIIAINTDPNAPIYDIADYGIVADLFEIVPALIEEFGG